MTKDGMEWEGLTLANALERAVQGHPERPFLDFSGEVHTYGSFDESVNRLAAGLRSLGVLRGDTVCTILDNTIDAVAVWFAINRLGAVSVPTNTVYKGEFLRRQVDDSGARVVVVEPDLLDRLAAVAGGIPEVQTVLCSTDAPSLTAVGNARVDALNAYRVDSGAIRSDRRPEDLACLIYTSGTTGPSKGCMVTHSYLFHLASQMLQASRQTQDEVSWTALPLFHLNAVCATVTTTLLLGGLASIAP